MEAHESSTRDPGLVDDLVIVRASRSSISLEPFVRVQLKVLFRFGRLEDLFEFVGSVDDVGLARAPAGGNVFDRLGCKHDPIVCVGCGRTD